MELLQIQDFSAKELRETPVFTPSLVDGEGLRKLSNYYFEYLDNVDKRVDTISQCELESAVFEQGGQGLILPEELLKIVQMVVEEADFFGSLETEDIFYDELMKWME